MFGYNYDLPYHGYNTMNNIDDHDFSTINPTNLFPSSTTATLLPSPLMANPSYTEHDSISALMKAELTYSYSQSHSSSGCSSYGSPTSYGTNNSSNFLQRSISSLSLQKNTIQGFSTPAYADSETSSVRKVYSTSDMQQQQEIKVVRRNDDQHRWSENPISVETSIIESMNKACSKYTPEEKKERIERYRSKRNLRNFNKKIKYECRKTLADSRPRIRGRFARNDEINKTYENGWVQTEEDDEEEDEADIENWLNFLDAYNNSANFI